MWALFLAPFTYLLAHSLGMYFAYDTLISELATRGARAVQQQTGELGRSAARDTLWTIVPFTLIVAPIGEELLFRGGVYGAVQTLFDRFERRPAKPDPGPSSDLGPDSLQIAGLPQKRGGPTVLTKVSDWIVHGGGAALVSGALFGALHADTPGGLGIVRGVSATALGIACGLARTTTGGLAAAIALHAGYNFIALGTMRGWLVSVDYPTKYGVPTVLGPVAGTLLAVVVIHALVHRRATRARR
jgi:membrane protease YdiL (CAAX protease family)